MIARGRRGALWRDTSGGALTEGAIVLPVFILLFAMVNYFYQTFQETQGATSQARRDMWARALPGCTQGGDPDLELQELLGTQSFNLRARANTSKLAPFFDTVRTTDIEVSESVSVDRPGVLGGGTGEYRALLRAECNEPYPYAPDSGRDTERVLWSAVQDTFCTFAPCASSGAECTPPARQCLSIEFEQTCTSVAGSGVWEVPRACNLDALEVCLRGYCEACDPASALSYDEFVALSPQDRAQVDTPPCPPGIDATQPAGGEAT